MNPARITVVLLLAVSTQAFSQSARTRTKVPSSQAPTAREIRLLSENDSLRHVVASLETKLASRTAVDSSSATAAREKALLDQVIVRLDRLQAESPSFVSAQTKSDLNAEESRLKSVARDQEAQARSIVADLRAAGYTFADSADHLVQTAASSYVLYVGYSRINWEYLATLGRRPELEAKQAEFYKKFAAAVSALKALK
jgi:hypothetical protein